MNENDPNHAAHHGTGNNVSDTNTRASHALCGTKDMMDSTMHQMDSTMPCNTDHSGMLMDSMMGSGMMDHH